MACWLLVPLCAIAIYALALRVGEHGWTNDRIIAAACLVIASCYAAGYALAAVRKGWLLAIAPVNVAAAFVVIAVLLALLAPIANPERLSLSNQLARLKAGTVSASEFDYAYLRFEGGRYGRDALAQLRAGASGNDAAAIRQGVDEVLALTSPRANRKPGEALAPRDLAANLTVWPATARLPRTFMNQAWKTDQPIERWPTCLRQAGDKCDLFLLDLAGDSKPELVVIGGSPGRGAAVMAEDSQGKWRVIGKLPAGVAGCKSLRDAIAVGNLRAAEPGGKALEIDGHRLGVDYSAEAPLYSCPQ